MTVMDNRASIMPAGSIKGIRIKLIIIIRIAKLIPNT
jgi:hypothetical protein